MKNKYFIATYTNEVKDYCDEKFFTWLHHIKEDNPVWVADNTPQISYFKKLQKMTKEFDFNMFNIMVPREPKRTLFLRNVTESVNALRDEFLKTDIPYFVIIESDVIPPEDLFAKFDKDISYLKEQDWNRRGDDGVWSKAEKNWGIIGGHYYKGFHDYSSMKGLYPTHHALSGCTVYKRDLIEKYPFRWSEENLGAFPDAWICYDSGKEFGIYNDGSIECEHLSAPNGTRQSRQL